MPFVIEGVARRWRRRRFRRRRESPAGDSERSLPHGASLWKSLAMPGVHLLAVMRLVLVAHPERSLLKRNSSRRSRSPRAPCNRLRAAPSRVASLANRTAPSCLASTSTEALERSGGRLDRRRTAWPRIAGGSITVLKRHGSTPSRYRFTGMESPVSRHWADRCRFLLAGAFE